MTADEARTGDVEALARFLEAAHDHGFTLDDDDLPRLLWREAVGPILAARRLAPDAAPFPVSVTQPRRSTMSNTGTPDADTGNAAAGLRAAWAHVVRDHGMPPNKDRRGYDYRMGWWDAVAYADRIIDRGIRFCEDCPGPLDAAPAPTEDRHPIRVDDPANPHRGDCTGTRCPVCGCCMHCIPDEDGICATCRGCADPDCECPPVEGITPEDANSGDGTCKGFPAPTEDRADTVTAAVEREYGIQRGDELSHYGMTLAQARASLEQQLRGGWGPNVRIVVRQRHVSEWTEVSGLEDVLAAHQYDYPDSFCECGAHMPKPWTDHPAHVAAAIREHLTSDAAVERASEALSVDEMGAYNPDAHPDHNRWTWRGDGHGEAIRDEFRKRARAALTAALEAP